MGEPLTRFINIPAVNVKRSIEIITATARVLNPIIRSNPQTVSIHGRAIAKKLTHQ
jgi:hypothetical protein